MYSQRYNLELELLQEEKARNRAFSEAIKEHYKNLFDPVGFDIVRFRHGEKGYFILRVYYHRKIGGERSVIIGIRKLENGKYNINDNIYVDEYGVYHVELNDLDRTPVENILFYGKKKIERFLNRLFGNAVL